MTSNHSTQLDRWKCFWSYKIFPLSDYDKAQSRFLFTEAGIGIVVVVNIT